MKYLTNFILKALSVLTIIGQVIFSLGGIGVIFTNGRGR